MNNQNDSNERYGREVTEKEAASKMQAAAEDNIRRHGSIREQILGGALVARTSMRESILGQLQRAQQESYRRERLERLVYLADKNPEFMEMIELVSDLGLM